jgi:L-threonylcarbamoyladenylate synthase
MDNKILPADSPKTLISAAERILKGGIIAYPTETVYGLGARYDDDRTLRRLYRLKKRPADKTMPLIIGGIPDLDLLVGSIPDSAKKIIEIFWPGPLTIVFRAKKNLSSFVTRDSGIAVRMPGESFALRLVRAVGMPITSTSANISGMPPAGNAATAAEYFGSEIDMIVDGGASPANMPSTIIDVTQKDFRILREGVISLTDILASIR